MEPNKPIRLQFVERCKCCLEGGHLKCMWSEYMAGDENVVYGVLLIECFGLTRQGPTDDTEKICDKCIRQLQDACTFKKKVLASEQILLEDLLQGETHIKQDFAKMEVEVEILNTEEDDEIWDNSEKNYVLQEDIKVEEEAPVSTTDLQESQSQEDKEDDEEEDAEYLELEFLEDENKRDKKSETEQTSKLRKWPQKKKTGRGIKKRYSDEVMRRCMEVVKNNIMTRSEAAKFYNVHIRTLNGKLRREEIKATNLQDSESQEDEEEEDDGEEEDAEYLELESLEDENKRGKKSETAQTSKLRKWPQNKKKGRGIKKRYSDELMKRCMEAVRNNIMTRSQAAKFFNVHVKTLTGKLRREEIAATTPSKVVEESEEVIREEKKQTKFMDEIKTILTYTNATPYKTKSGRYYCAYCFMDSSDRKYFDDPGQLRIHTRTSHAEERLGSVERFMSPLCTNEVLKLDIEKLTCVVCCTDIASWNDLFVHLKEIHDVDMDEAYTRVIPYCLTSDLRCALCNESYQKYHILDGHMNAHYNNYICGQCGNTYLAENRLQKHLETHSLKQYPCHVCKKVFTLEKYRKKHEDYVHYPKDNIKCMYCSEKFRSEHARHIHMTKKHKEKVKRESCDICKKTYSWRPYYLKHMRVVHGKREKKHKCQLCDREFMMKYELKNHESWHRGESSHVCGICDKKFTSKNYLQKHYQSHVEEVTVVVVNNE